MTNLPETYTDLEEVVGLEPASALIRQFGGQKLYIPVTPKPEHRLFELGEEAARAIAHHYAGETLEVPSLKAPIRREIIWKLSRQGYSRNEIAARVGVTERRVRQVLAEGPPANEMISFAETQEGACARATDTVSVAGSVAGSAAGSVAGNPISRPADSRCPSPRTMGQKNSQRLSRPV